MRQRYIYSWFGIHAVLRGASSFIAAEALQYFQVLHQCCKQHHGDCIQSFVFFRSFYHRLGVATPSRSCPLSETAWGVRFSSRCRLHSIPTLCFWLQLALRRFVHKTHAVVVLWALSRYKPFNRDPPISGSVVLDKLKVNELTCIASRRHR